MRAGCNCGNKQARRKWKVSKWNSSDDDNRNRDTVALLSAPSTVCDKWFTVNQTQQVLLNIPSLILVYITKVHLRWDSASYTIRTEYVKHQHLVDGVKRNLVLVLRGTNIRLKQTEWAKESLSYQQHANMSCVNPKILFLQDFRGLKANMCCINKPNRSQYGTYKCHIMVLRCFSFHI